MLKLSKGLLVAVVCCVAVNLHAEDKQDDKPVNLTALAVWSHAWKQSIQKASRNPLQAKQLREKKHEEYDKLIKGKKVEGTGTVVAMSVDPKGGGVTLLVRVSLKVPDAPRFDKKGKRLPPTATNVSLAFNLKIKDKNDPVLKTLKVGGKDASVVKVSAALSGDSDSDNVTRLVDGEVVLAK